MPTYKYTARDQDGKTVAGKIAADNEPLIVTELRKRNLVIISITEQRSSRPKNTTTKKGGPKKKVKSEDIVIFTRQFATMIDAGIPILQALEALGEQTSNPTFRDTVQTIQSDIQLGTSLSAAFAKHEKIFDSLYVNMIRVGETGGVLTAILERVAMYLEKSEKLKAKLQSAMIYPGVIVSMAMLITLVLIIKVVPTFSQIYDSLNQELPAMTRMLIGLSNFLQKQFFLMIAIIVGCVMGFAQLKRTQQGRFVLDSVALKLPVFGDLIRKVAISRFCRTFSTLSQSGVPILESLDIVGKTAGNVVIESLVEQVKLSVREGQSVAEPLSRSDVFPPMVVRMIAIGEKSGQMEKMLSKVAEFYDEQVDTAVEGLTKLIEPLIIGFLGIVVGFIVVALFMPILNLTSALG
jgi:type IV pilus assembly protein PilC